MKEQSKASLDMRPTRVIPAFAYSQKWGAEVLTLKVKKGNAPYETFELSVTRDYVTDWQPFHALRELIANSLDAVGGDSARISLEYSHPNQNKSKTVLRNTGATMRLEHFLLGGGDFGTDTIGQFHEGLKLALLVLTRAGYAVNLIFSPTKTVITILGLEPETVKKAKSLFLAFQSHRTLWQGDESAILGQSNGENAVYVQGLKQELGGKSLYFSYSIPKETVPIGRDRHISSDWELANACAGLIWEIDEPALMREVTDTLLKTQGVLYFDLSAERLRWEIKYGSDSADAWKEYFKERFSESVICGSDREKYHIEALGKTPLIVTDSNLAEVFEALGVEGFENLADENWDIDSWDFAGGDLDRLNGYLETIDTVFPELKAREYEYFLFREKDNRRRRRAFVNGRSIFVREGHWAKGNPLTLYGTFLHELAHRGGDDLSSGFEEKLTLLLGKAVNFIAQDRRTIAERFSRNLKGPEIEPKPDYGNTVTGPDPDFLKNRGA